MIAMATVLSMVKIFTMPQGGSVTLASMVPLILVSYRHGLKWGAGTAFAHKPAADGARLLRPAGANCRGVCRGHPPRLRTGVTVLGRPRFLAAVQEQDRPVSPWARPRSASSGFYAASLSGILIWAASPRRHTRVAVFADLQRQLYAAGDRHHRRRHDDPRAGARPDRRRHPEAGGITKPAVDMFIMREGLCKSPSFCRIDGAVMI